MFIIVTQASKGITRAWNLAVSNRSGLLCQSDLQKQGPQEQWSPYEYHTQIPYVYVNG